MTSPRSSLRRLGAATLLLGTAVAVTVASSPSDVDDLQADLVVETAQLDLARLVESDQASALDDDRFAAELLDADLDQPVHAALVGEVNLFIGEEENLVEHANLTATVDAYVGAEQERVAAEQARIAAEQARIAEEQRQAEATRVAATRGSVWDRLAQCESTGRWSYNGGSGFDGGLQFHPQTWSAYRLSGYPAYAYQASREQQIAVAERVLAAQGWGAWPACSRKLGLR